MFPPITPHSLHYTLPNPPHPQTTPNTLKITNMSTEIYSRPMSPTLNPPQTPHTLHPPTSPRKSLPQFKHRFWPSSLLHFHQLLHSALQLTSTIRPSSTSPLSRCTKLNDSTLHPSPSTLHFLDYRHDLHTGRQRGWTEGEREYTWKAW